jgi:ATP-dependent DNA ligase
VASRADESYAAKLAIADSWMKPQRPPLTKVKFIEPMCAKLVNELPEERNGTNEVKFDGYRCL